MTTVLKGETVYMVRIWFIGGNHADMLAYESKAEALKFLIRYVKNNKGYYRMDFRSGEFKVVNKHDARHHLDIREISLMRSVTL
jgi:phenylacetate-coenzyme A ligase PaaK-like adenylate-forming protein